jgi:hypothetical protein
MLVHQLHQLRAGQAPARRVISTTDEAEREYISRNWRKMSKLRVSPNDRAPPHSLALIKRR